MIRPLSGRFWVAAVVVALLATLLPQAPVSASDSRLPHVMDSQYIPMAPVRLVDTREMGERLKGGWILPIQVTGRANVPDAAGSVSLNVTAVDAAGAVPGWLTVFPCPSDPLFTLPNSSNVNFGPGQTIANSVVSGIGAWGRVCVYASQPTHVVVDISGYFPAGNDLMTPQKPERLADTRGTGVPVAGGSVLRVQVAGRGTVPADATAAALNVTAVQAAGSGPGWLTVFPCTSDPNYKGPNASNVNYVPGQTVANFVVSGIGDQGQICVYAAQSTHVLVDFGGSFLSRSYFWAITPARLADTRSTPGARVAAGSVLKVQVAGRGEVPADARAAALNVTATQAAGSGAGWLTVFPCSSDPNYRAPNASNVNYLPGQTVPNSVMSGIGDQGQICIYTSQPTHVVVDIGGYFRGSPNDVTPPDPITGLTVGKRTSSSIELSWVLPSDVDLGRVLVRRASGDRPPSRYDEGQEVAIANRWATSLVDSGLEPDRDYSYAFFTVDFTGNLQSESATVTTRTLPTPPGPSPVTDLRVGEITKQSIALSWQNPTDVDLAEVIVRRAEGSAPPEEPSAGSAVALASPKATSVVDDGLSLDTEYSYSVFTRDGLGNIRPSPVTATARTAGPVHFEELGVGSNDVCAIDSTGAAWCWSEFTYTSALDGTSHYQGNPVRVEGGHQFTSLAVGGSHACAIDASSATWCWGGNWDGQLGDGTTTSRSIPVQVGGERSFVSLAAGLNHTCGLDSDGQAWCWGRGLESQLGNKTAQSSSHPQKVVGPKRFTSLSAGGIHTCGLDSSGDVWCWGGGWDGQIGEQGGSPWPVETSIGRNFASITAGNKHTCGVTTSGTAYCWGDHSFGKLGIGFPQEVPVPPTEVSGGLNFGSVSAGGERTCGVDREGQGWCWGATTPWLQRVWEPARVDGDVPFASIATASTAMGSTLERTCGLDVIGRIWCWNHFGDPTPRLLSIKTKDGD